MVLLTARRALEALTLNGEVALYKGNVSVLRRTSPFSKHSRKRVSFEAGAGAAAYERHHPEGFIRMNALRFTRLSDLGHEGASQV